LVGIYRLKREKQYPQPHDVNASFLLNCKVADRICTIIPAVHHDEAMLASGKNTHPEHASFAETTASNCCAESKVFKIMASMRISLTKSAITTDGIEALRIGFMSIHGAFEDFDANDELTSVTTGDILELTKETTDRQTYPIYDGTDLTDKYTNSAHLNTDAMGLTTDTGLENVVFDIDQYYDALHYYTNGDKLKKVQNGLRWITLTKDNPTRVIHFRTSSNVKSINPYTFLGHLVVCPNAGTKYQIPIDADVTNVNHVSVEYRCRYLEWNDNFQHQRA
jgi:hypothetical protein